MAKTLRNKTLTILIIVILASFLRLWKLDKVPVSLFLDELEVGYHAYSLLKTGKDFSGNSWPLNFESYADMRTPFNIYTTVPTVAIFGINSLGVRLPVALFGIATVWGLYLLVNQLFKNERMAVVASLIMAVSPWHIQYSRVALEVSQLLALLIFGFYFFFKSIEGTQKTKRKMVYLIISIILLLLTPLVYSTAKFFMPVMMLSMVVMWGNGIFSFPYKLLKYVIPVGLLLGGLVIFSAFFSGGNYRFSYISLFSDPTAGTEVDYARFYDAVFRKDDKLGAQPKLLDKLYHNKIVFWLNTFKNNLFRPFSTDFLFLNGDPNLRHSPKNIGEFYFIESIPLLLGLILFFTIMKDKRIRLFITLWIVFGIIPSSITRIGGNHATRLILILPPLIILIAYGLTVSYGKLSGYLGKIFVSGYLMLWVLAFLFYQHNYWVHYPWDSERMWHSEYKSVIDTAYRNKDNYKRIVISNANERPQIFFAAYTQFDPAKWHKGLSNEVVNGFGKIEYIGQFYFGQVEGVIGINKLSEHMDKDTLYLAAEREVGANLLMNPEKTPGGLRLVDTVKYPSGEIAFYAFDSR